MNPHHLQIIKELQKISGLSQSDFEGFALKYVGSNKSWYHLKSGQTRQLVKDFIKNHKFSSEELADLINSLYWYGQSFEEICIAALIVGASPNFRQEFDISLVNIWLDHVHGWAETDVLCQMAFTDQDLLLRWSDWQNLLLKFNQDENIHKRRASLVLLTKPVRLSSDRRLSELAFSNTQNLKLEKHILITKAVSWILRSLIKYHSPDVSDFLEDNQETLPKIALREVRTKLETGKKYINKKTEK